MRKVLLVTVAALTVLAGTSTATADRGGARGKHAASTCTGTLASGKYHRLVVRAGGTGGGSAATGDVRAGVRVGEGATCILGTEPGESDLRDAGRIPGGVR